MRIKMINLHKVIIGDTERFSIVILILFAHLLCASGGYDHGTSTGKGKLQIDLTWNPFNYFENGQSYMVFGYGITNKIDLHGYYADHGNYNDGVDSYYYGIFFQFLDSKYLDLATAIGKRKMMHLDYSHIFFPQVLYNIKLGKGYTIGGSLVTVRNDIKTPVNNKKNEWLTFDIALFIPLTKYIPEKTIIEEIKLGIGTFTYGLYQENNSTLYAPTYSIDIKLNKPE